MKSIQLPDVTKLSDLSVFDKDGNTHIIESLWKEKRAALVFVRHYG